MLTISYNSGCRNCFKSDNIRHQHLLMDADENLYKQKTEFAVVQEIEKWMMENEHHCQFCRMNNLEIMDLEVNDYPLYDYDRLVEECMIKEYFMLLITIEKKDYQPKLKRGGSKFQGINFLANAFKTIQATVENRPIDVFMFQRKSNGHCFFSIIGGLNHETGEQEVILHRFRHAGFSKEEILSSINTLKEHINKNL